MIDSLGLKNVFKDNITNGRFPINGDPDIAARHFGDSFYTRKYFGPDGKINPKETYFYGETISDITYRSDPKTSYENFCDSKCKTLQEHEETHQEIFYGKENDVRNKLNDLSGKWNSKRCATFAAEAGLAYAKQKREEGIVDNKQFDLDEFGDCLKESRQKNMSEKEMKLKKMQRNIKEITINIRIK